MKYIFLFLTTLLLSLQGLAQTDSLESNDSPVISIPFRYFFFTAGLGAELTSRKHSFGLIFNLNYLPMQWDMKTVTSLAGEYKRYYSSGRPDTENYFGAYVLAMKSAYPRPEESDWEGSWYRSSSLNIGPFCGYKRYWGKRMYYDLFVGAHVGKQAGTRRWDEKDPTTNSQATRLEEDEKLNYGIRLGINLGIQLN